MSAPVACAAVRSSDYAVSISVALDVDRFGSARLGDQVEGAAYFFVSEALANVLRHSRASWATVRIASRDGWLIVEVTDDGVGFDPERGGGSGLPALADRLSALGGAVEVLSHPGEGTTVRCRVPLRSPHPAGVADG